MKWLLKSCSDFFSDGWTYEESNWRLGIRQAPFVWENLQLNGTQNEVTDFIFDYPRPILCSEFPFLTLQIKVPTLTGDDSFGFRVTEIAEPAQTLWPGIFIKQSGIYFRALSYDSLIQPTEQETWYTFGLSWNSEGVLQIYIDGQLVAQDTGTISPTETSPLYIKKMFQVNGIFLQVKGDCPWILNGIFTAADIVPKLHIDKQETNLQLTIQNEYPQESYQLQGSFDLINWQDLESLTQPIESSQQFYRIHV